MMTKERLQKYKPLIAEEKQLRDRLKEIETPIYSPDTQKLTGMPHAPSAPGGGSKQEKIADKTWALRKWYRKKIADIHGEQLAIEQAIDSIDDNEMRLVLRHRYMEGRSWESVALRMDCSTSKAHELHSAALELLKRT